MLRTLIHPRATIDSSTQSRRLDLLLTPGFVAALTLLAVNDAYLKHAFHNWLTGKLSDFAGLFAFAVFLCALLPRRRHVSVVVTGAAFLVWKSALASPLLLWWNDLGVLPLSRVVDPTDLVALCVLPIAFLHAGRARGAMSMARLEPVIVAASVVVFVATSARDESPLNGMTWVLPIVLDSARASLARLDDSSGAFFVYIGPRRPVDTLYVTTRHAETTIELRAGRRDQTVLTILKVSSITGEPSYARDVSDEFLDNVLTPLREGAERQRQSER